MNKIIFIIFITALSTITNYAMNPEINYYSSETIKQSPSINFANFAELYVEYAFHLSKTCSTIEELNNALLLYEDTPTNRKIMKTTLTNKQTPNNVFSNEEILISILKKNNVNKTQINNTLRQYQEQLNNITLSK